MEDTNPIKEVIDGQQVSQETNALNLNANQDIADLGSAQRMKRGSNNYGGYLQDYKQELLRKGHSQALLFQNSRQRKTGKQESNYASMSRLNASGSQEDVVLPAVRQAELDAIEHDREASPGPGHYTDIYAGSSFAVRSNGKHPKQQALGRGGMRFTS